VAGLDRVLTGKMVLARKITKTDLRKEEEKNHVMKLLHAKRELGNNPTCMLVKVASPVTKVTSNWSTRGV
jgi:hypothetical protein